MLLFGTAGIPHSCRQGLPIQPRRNVGECSGAGPRSAKAGDTISGLARIKKLGLEAMELEFVRGVNMTSTMANEVRKAKKRLGIQLTCHAPYFINLNSSEPPKYKASIKRILDSARIGYRAGAESVTFHPGFYQGQEPETVYHNIKEAIRKIIRQLSKEKIKITLKPELTGKPTQFGSLDELLNLAKEINIGLCLDISHLHARSGGKFNTYEEFMSVWKKIKTSLGKNALNNMHIHISGIKYSAKGEREHLNLKQSDFNYQAFIKSLKENNVGGIVICESPNLEDDALLLKKIYYNN